MNSAIWMCLGAALLVGACASGGDKAELPAYVAAADRSASCAEAVHRVAQRRAEEADDPQAKTFAQARIDRMAEIPPTPENAVCYVAHVEADGDLMLNGIYTNESYVSKTLRMAKYNPRLTYTYFRITNPPGKFSRSVVFKLTERLKDLQIDGGLMTKFDAEIRGEDKLDAGSRALPQER